MILRQSIISIHSLWLEVWTLVWTAQCLNDVVYNIANSCNCSSPWYTLYNCWLQWWLEKPALICKQFSAESEQYCCARYGRYILVYKGNWSYGYYDIPLTNIWCCRIQLWMLYGKLSYLPFNSNTPKAQIQKQIIIMESIIRMDQNI